jgi:hypothetical protein
MKGAILGPVERGVESMRTGEFDTAKPRSFVTFPDAGAPRAAELPEVNGWPAAGPRGKDDPPGARPRAVDLVQLGRVDVGQADVLADAVVVQAEVDVEGDGVAVVHLENRRRVLVHQSSFSVKAPQRHVVTEHGP